MNRISIEFARQMMVAAQGLDRAPGRPAVKADVRELVRRMGFLQIDTINVVARSPYLVLWSRLGDYRTEWLDELLAERALFEYWAHAMCFLPIEDYPLHRRRMLDAMRDGLWPVRWAVKWIQEHPDVVERVRAHIRENGGVRSAEFENKDHKSGGWWNWKEEKDALEALLMTGEVMIARRQNFQRVYDLRERILPAWEDNDDISPEDLQRTLMLRAVYALGIAFPAWIPDYFRQPKKGLNQRLKSLVDEGMLQPVEVEGLEGLAYVHRDRANLIEEVASGDRTPTLTTLLSPFDPLVSDRQRARELFNFDYTIECYTPAAKRRYGYFTLPILQRGRLIGRLDPKAHRSQGIFEIRVLHLEPGVDADEEMVADLAAALHRLADWHATPELVIRRSNPTEIATYLNSFPLGFAPG